MIRATLKEYTFLQCPEGERLVGKIYNDRDRNFPDGYRIITSVIVSKDLKNSQVKTHNSIYQLSEEKNNVKNSNYPH